MYEELKEMLTRLFRKLYFPMGGSNDNIQAIWMEEPDKKLITICTEAGYTTVFPNGAALSHNNVEQVERLYVKFFTERGSLESMFNNLSDGYRSVDIAPFTEGLSRHSGSSTSDDYRGVEISQR